MKVLWFSNTPANADEYLNKKLMGSGGWLKSLDQELQKKVDLHVSFYYEKEINSFSYKNTQYYPIYKKKKNILKSYFDYINAKILVKDDIDRYLKIVKIVNPDIIHVHGTENPFGYINEYVDIPIVISIQGLLSSIYYKYVSGYFFIDFNSSDNLYTKLVGIRRFKRGFELIKKMAIRERDILENSKYIIGRTNWDGNITRVLSPKSQYFHNDEMLRDGFYNHTWNKKRENIITIFSVMGNNPYKGLETIFQTKEIVDLYGNFEWKIAGISKTDTIVKAIEKKQPNSISFLGKLTENDIITNMLSSDIFVSASHIENSPNALSEAMLLGMPSIATFAGGTSSLIENNKEGVIIQEGDPWGIASAILGLKNNYNKACFFGKNAKIRATKRHDKEVIISSLINIYKDIILT